jgi:flavin reductase (DIM6/NTAB) family NADH-FMN oxidoreductase RutF
MTAPHERSHLGGKTFDERYKLLSGAVIPRPIAFVSTLNQDGSVNAALFSSSWESA